MPASELGPWEPLDVDAVVARFDGAPFRWWISGGRALELHLGRTWRSHDDTDIGVVRTDTAAIHSYLSDWDLHVAASGSLTPWQGEMLDESKAQNNVWCRADSGGPWILDLLIGDGNRQDWIY